MSLLDIKNLSVRFGDTTAVPVVDGLDLSVDKGEVLAIVGESGSGKSVTMMALMGLIDAPGWVSADHLRFDGHDMLTLKGRQRRRIVGKDMAMVFQDPMTALNPSYTVGYQIEEVLRLHLGLRGKALRQRALELLERVEIPAAASRLDAYPHQLSLHRGADQGDPRALCRRSPPGHPARHRSGALRPPARLPAVATLPLCPGALPPGAAGPGGTRARRGALLLSVEPAERGGLMETVLTARDLTRHYEVSRGLFKGHAQVRALNGVSFELEAGKTLAVVGESGCGKSTLARALTLIEEPTSGSLKIAGQEVKGASKDQRRQLRRDVQMVFQNPYASLNPRQKIGDQLAEPLLINTALSREERREKVQQMMRQVGLRPEHYQRYPHMFSGGQRQRIALARAMMLQPKVLVADEPTSALDVSIQAQVLNLFMDLQQQFRTAYVFISHNLAVVRHVADDVLVMYLGRPAEMGPADKLYENPLHPYTRALLSATPAIHPDPTKPKIRIQGELPNPLNPPEGCAFHKRCPYATERCRSEVPELRLLDQRQVACHHAEQFLG